MTRLKRLTLSGFKSFARTTAFEFPAAVSAIVGPNGAGKSNLAEAIRWVLGEQSLKTLRGKRGEDLIFNGSPTVPRMGKAAVALTFDNRDRSIRLDFSEVTIERKIFRDGVNEYALNGSPVRLRDIVELIARLGLGESKHNLIGQGEVDRILAASPRERREMLEEAIGLRIWQLKKREAERKLDETRENMRQVEALRREIAPHLRFLKSQADKAEKRDVVKRELTDYYRAYVRAEGALIRESREHLQRESGPATAKLAALEREIAAIGQAVGPADRESADPLKEQEQAVATLEAKRRELERALGRIEGRLEGSQLAPDRTAAGLVPAEEIEAALTPIVASLRDAAGLEDLGSVRERVRSAREAIERFLVHLRNRSRSAEAGAGEGELRGAQARVQRELASLDRELERASRERAASIRRVREREAALRERWRELREREEETRALRAVLQRVTFETERLAFREQELERLIAESGCSAAELETGETPFAVLAPDELQKKIEKLKLRLEEIGGIDPAVLNEYRETRTRHDFLERELADLTAAERNLRSLIAELNERIERDFKAGFAKVRESFRHYFTLIFGGGRGELSYLPLRKAAAEETTGEDGEGGDPSDRSAYGVEIDVNLPRKRIRGLAMLSGGERALVSAALLFAMSAVNPPPFLVLDETDAALDEANSQKYAAILRELSSKTQLILITHNRETMQQAGILYGVTMGEDGVSRVISLKLEEAEEYGER